MTETRSKIGCLVCLVLLANNIWFAVQAPDEVQKFTKKIGDIVTFLIPKECRENYILYNPNQDRMLKLGRTSTTKYVSRYLEVNNSRVEFRVDLEADFGNYRLLQYQNTSVECPVGFRIERLHEPQTTSYYQYYNETLPYTTEGITSRQSTAEVQVVPTAASKEDILQIMKDLEDGNVSTVGALISLTEISSVSTFDVRNLNDAKDVLEVILNKTELNSSNVDIVSKNFLNVASNLIATNKAAAWEEQQKQKNESAEKVINLVDGMVAKILDINSNESQAVSYTSNEIFMEIFGAVECNTNIAFPSGIDRTSELNFAKTVCPTGGDRTSYGGVIYHNIGNFIKLAEDIGNVSTTATELPNSKALMPTVLSFTMPGFNGQVSVNIKVNGEHWQDPSCVFLDKSTNSWSDMGCRLVSFDSQSVLCECNHLTNFAVLMSPTEISVHENEILNIISIIGCCFSIVCLLVTLVIHVAFLKRLNRNSKGSTKHLLTSVLSGTLIVTYIVFLVGIDKTDNQVICAAVAVILHYSLLTVFALMNAIGVDYLRMVAMPLSQKSLAKPLFLASFLGPAVIVGITLGVTRLEGYGDNKACWLSAENYVRMAFIIPASVIILINIGFVVAMFTKMFKTTAMQKKTEKERIKIAIRNVLLLTPVFGLTWMLGIFAINKETTVFQYAFVILNSLQGFFILVCHCILNQKVREVLIRRTLRRKMQLATSSEAHSNQRTLEQTTATSSTAVKDQQGVTSI